MNKKNIILVIIIILLIIAMIIAIAINSIYEKNKKTDISSEPHIKTAEEKQQEELEELRDMSEKSRMKFYVSKYFSYIEDNDYESAYNLLYDEFKKNYFPTQEEFEQYVKEKYPSFITLTYGTLERLGTYYVLTVNCSDLINDEKNSTQLFVLRENWFNDFVLSFQAE